MRYIEQCNHKKNRALYSKRVAHYKANTARKNPFRAARYILVSENIVSIETVPLSRYSFRGVFDTCAPGEQTVGFAVGHLPFKSSTASHQPSQFFLWFSYLCC